MNEATLYFATNRRHQGADRWHPDGYGKKFSKDGKQNLRFGELTMKVDNNKIDDCLESQSGGRTGDGEKLSGYLKKQAKTAIITAYEDETALSTKPIPDRQNASARMFRKLKLEMENAADVVIYIHGYNVDWIDAMGAALSLQYMLNRKNGSDSSRKVIVVLFSWPSDGSIMPYAAYWSDRIDARCSGVAMGRAILKLQDFLLSLHRNARRKTERLCEREIHLLCHSMGNFVLQKALPTLLQHSKGRALARIFQHVFLCAADVADDVLERNQPMGRLHETCENLSIYYNKGDLAMHISDYTKGQSDRLGHSGNANPRAVHNKIHQMDCSKIVKGVVEHSYYLWATVNNDIRHSIEGKDFDDPSRRRKRLSGSNEWALT